MQRTSSTGFTGGGGTIYWEEQGDFPAVFRSYNFEDNTTLKAIFPENNVHVEPRSRLDDERMSKINLALTLAITLLAFVESGILAEKFWHKKHQSKITNTSPNQSKNAPSRKNRAKKWVIS